MRGFKGTYSSLLVYLFRSTTAVKWVQNVKEDLSKMEDYGMGVKTSLTGGYRNYIPPPPEKKKREREK